MTKGKSLTEKAKEEGESSEPAMVFVSVKRKVVGMPEEFEEVVIEVPEAIATKQLALPPQKRNSHWRTAKLVEPVEKTEA